MLATALAVLSVLAPFAGPAPRWSAAEWDLRGSSIVLVEGINGGIVGPSRHRIVTFGYDWNRRVFRVVEQRIERDSESRLRAFRARDIDNNRFRDLVEQLVKLGLPALPLEEPAGCDDLYGRDTSVRFSHAARIWENKAPGGCVRDTSSIRVMPEHVAAFDAVVALLNRALAEGPLQPASALDALPVRDWSDLEVRTLSIAVDVLRKRGLASKVNANEAKLVGVEQHGLNIRVPCRNAQPFCSDSGPLQVPVGWWDVRFDPKGKRVEELQETPFVGESAADLARRAAFVEVHPELSVPERDLILAGWIGDGMTEAMVRVAWGDPVERALPTPKDLLLYMRGGSDS